MKKISTYLILPLITFHSLGLGNVLANNTASSEVLKTSEYFSTAQSNIFLDNSVLIDSNGYDKDVKKGVKRLVWKEGDDNSGNANFKLEGYNGNSIISSKANIGIFSPGRSLYAPYVPLEFQVNIPVAKEINGIISKYDTDPLLRIPLQHTTYSQGTDVEVSVYGLDSEGENLLGFDLFNSNKFGEAIKQSETNVNFFPENNNIIGNSENDFFTKVNSGKNGFYIKDKKVILSPTNYGSNNQDTDGDGFTQNGYINGTNLSINGDLFFGENSENSVYKEGNIFKDFNVKDFFTRVSEVGDIFNFRQESFISGNKIINITNSSTNDYIGSKFFTNFFTSISDKVDSFVLTLNNTTGVDKSNENFQIVDGEYVSNKSFSFNKINSVVGETSTINDIKILKLTVDKSGNISNVDTNYNYKSSSDYIIPQDFILGSEKTGDVNEFNIPYFSNNDIIGNLTNTFKTLEINSLMKFKSYDSDNVYIYIPYIKAKKINSKDITGKFILKKNVLFKNPIYIEDLKEKINNRDISSDIFSSKYDFERLSLSGTLINGVKEVEKSFSDGSTYLTTFSSNGGSVKILSYNPNVYPLSIYHKNDDFSMDGTGNARNNGKVINLNFNKSQSSRFNLNTLFKATPISSKYFREVVEDGKNVKYYYKVFVVQLKPIGDISLGSNENQSLFLGEIPIDLSIHTNPYLVDPASHTFLSVSTRKGSIGFPIHAFGNTASESVRANVFSQEGSPILRFNEVDGDNRVIDASSSPSVNPYSVKLLDSSGNDYLGLNTEGKTNISNEERLTIDKSNITIKTPQCIDGYQLFLKDKSFWSDLYSFDNDAYNYLMSINPEDNYKSPTGSGSEDESSNEVTLNEKNFENNGLLYLLNSGGPYTNNYNGFLSKPLTTYFNYPKPFCVNKNWSKTGDVNDLTSNEIATLLKYYVIGIDTNLKDNSSSSNIKIPDNVSSDEFLLETDTILSVEKNGTGYNIPSYIVNPLNYGFLYKTPGLSNEEDSLINRPKYKSFYDNYLLPSFQKLFITDKLIPEQGRLYGSGAKSFQSNNNSLELDNTYLLSKIFKFGNSGNSNDGKFDLNLLEGENSNFFPIIGSYIVVSNQSNTGINYCSSTNNEYYLDGKCINGNNGEILAKKPQYCVDGKCNEITIDSSIFNNTKVGRITKEGTTAPLTSGTSYYAGFSDKNCTGSSNCFTIFTQKGNSNGTNVDNSNGIISNYGKNIGGNMYSFLKVDKSSIKDLGFFVNYSMSSQEDLNNFGINVETKVSAYPFFYLKELKNEFNKTFADETVKDDIIKVPYHILKNMNVTSGSGTSLPEELLGISYIPYTNNFDGIYNESLFQYSITNLPVEDLFEKRNGEYGVYVKVGSNDIGTTSVDLTSGLLINKSNNLAKSKILTLVYSNDFTSSYNGIQINITHEKMNDFCFNTTLGSGKYFNCVQKYNNNAFGKRYVSSVRVVEEVLPPDLSDNCITNPDKEGCVNDGPITTKTSLSDQFTFNQLVGYEFNVDKALSLGDSKYFGNSLKLVDNNHTKKYLPEFSKNSSIIKESDGVLARKQNEITKFKAEGIGNINDFIYNNGSVEDKLQNSMNYNNIYNDDSVIVTNGRQYLDSLSGAIAGGYITMNSKANGSSIIDRNYGFINDTYHYSDNDNLLEDNLKFGTNNIVPGLSTDQSRRNRISEEVFRNNHAYVSLANIPKDKLFSMNGILRISKDSRKYFSNLIIQMPTGANDTTQTKLLNDLNQDPRNTIYAYNNLTFVYNNKYYTWGMNDTSCNGIDPNAVYNRIDEYKDINENPVPATYSRSDTITICLVDSGNSSGLTAKNEMLTDLEIRLPIKPTRTHAVFKDGTGGEFSIIQWLSLMNDVSSNRYGLRYSNTSLGSKISSYDKRYYVGTMNSINSTIGQNISNSYVSPFLTNLRSSMSIKTTTYTDGSVTYRYSGSYNISQGALTFTTNNIQNDIQIKNIPQIFLNGFIIRDSNPFILGKNEIKIESKIVTSEKYGSTYSNFSRNGTSGWYSSRSSAENYILTNARSIPFENLFSLSKQDSLVEKTLSGYTIEFIQLPKYNISDYTNGINFSSKILDSYQKTGNYNSGTLGNYLNQSNNFVISSLKENNNKIAIGDILNFEVEINADALDLSKVSMQNMYVQQILDRGLELIPDTLQVEGTNLGKEISLNPIYNNNITFRDIINNSTNTEFQTKINNQKSQKFLNNEIDSFIDLNNHKDEIVVKKGVLFLELVSGQGKIGDKILSNTSIRYIRPGDKFIEENVNGLYGSFADTDILDRGISNFSTNDILVLFEGENISRTNIGLGVNGDVRFRVLNLNKLPNSLLDFNIYQFKTDKNIINKSNTLGIDAISTGLGGNSNVTPRYIQNKFYYENPNNTDKCITVEGESDALSINGKFYCSAYNKYMDNVYKGYLQLSSPYNRLIGPDKSNPFVYGGLGGILDIYREFNNKKSINLLRNSDRNTDRDKMLLVNVGNISKGDKVRVKYSAVVLDTNNINHRLYNYNYSPSNGISDTATGIVLNDTIMTGNQYINNNNIYTHAKNTKLFYINHFGGEEVIHNKELSLENGSSLNSLSVGPKTHLSIVNLSGRKNYYVCDIIQSKEGDCRKVGKIDTYNKFDNLKDGNILGFPNWEKISEPTIELYKGQKIVLRKIIENPYYNKGNSINNISNGTVNITYNSDFLLSDNKVYKSTSSSNNYNVDYSNNIMGFSTDIPTNTVKNIKSIFKNIIINRQSHNSIQEENINGNIDTKFKTIEYNLSADQINDYNTKGRIVIDFLFTVKYTENKDTLNKEALSSYNKNILSSVMSSFEYNVTNNTENRFNIDSLVNSYGNGSINYLKTNDNGINQNTNTGSSINITYINIKLDENDNPNNKDIKEFNPNLGNLSIKYFDESNNKSGLGTSGSVGLNIELLNRDLLQTKYTNSFKVTLPYGYDISNKSNKIVGYKIVETDMFNSSVVVDNNFNLNVNSGNSYKIEDFLNKKIITINTNWVEIKAGRKYNLFVYLDFEGNKVDPISTFTVESSLCNDKSNSNCSYLFSDTQSTEKSNYVNDIVKTLPTFKENNVFVGNAYTKNNVNNDDYIDKNSGESNFYIIGESGKPVLYKSNKIEDTIYIDQGNKPKFIIDIKNILDDVKNSYSVEKLNSSTMNMNISGSKFELTNNTVYYFEGDLNIGDFNSENKDYEIIFKNNSNKPKGGGVTIIASGRIIINSNIVNNKSGNEQLNNISNIGFIGLRGTIFNPRVTKVDGYFYSPVTSNSVAVSSAYSEGVITTGYSNNTLDISGGVYGGTILNERKQGGGLNEENLNTVENYEFNNFLYLNPPPVFRK